MNYPGAAAQPRPPASAGFREADATSGFALSPNALNPNGANKYQFAMSNPAVQGAAGVVEANKWAYIIARHS
jgi:hypothetical protein